MNSIDNSDYIIYYFSLIDTFYSDVKNDVFIQSSLKKIHVDVDIMNLENFFKNNFSISYNVMPNKEIRFRVVDNKNKSSYVVTNSLSKQYGGSPHQNSHEHYYVSEIFRVDQGSVIASTLLPNKNAKLSLYKSGDIWISVPGVTHNSSLYDGTCTTTFKTPSPLQDWYGTGNIINSANSYLLDSYTKSLDLDEMSYIIKNNEGIIDDKICEQFNIKERWRKLLKDYNISPYEILIDDKNRSLIQRLLLKTSSNDIGAFYAILAKLDINKAIELYSIYGDNILSAFSMKPNDFIDLERAQKFAKERKLIK